MVEYYNIIRDHLNKPTIDLNELKQLQTKISQDESVYFITQDITSKLIYYIIETLLLYYYLIITILLHYFYHITTKLLQN